MTTASTEASGIGRRALSPLRMSTPCPALPKFVPRRTCARRSGRWRRSCGPACLVAQEVCVERHLERFVEVAFGAEEPGFKQGAESSAAFLGSPHGIFEGRALRLQDMVRKHMPHGSRTFPFEAAKQIVEFKGAGEEAEHLLLYGLDLQDEGFPVAEDRGKAIAGH